MPQKLLPLIISLKHWREQNGFSQSDAVKVLKNTGIPVTLDSLQNGSPAGREGAMETGRRLSRGRGIGHVCIHTKLASGVDRHNCSGFPPRNWSSV
jgi:hypothetical protein